VRARRSGPSWLVAGKAEPRWHASARQYRDPMQIGLLAAGIGSLCPLRQPGTGVLLILLTLFNAADLDEIDDVAHAGQAGHRRHGGSALRAVGNRLPGSPRPVTGRFLPPVCPGGCARRFRQIPTPSLLTSI